MGTEDMSCSESSVESDYSTGNFAVSLATPGRHQTSGTKCDEDEERRHSNRNLSSHNNGDKEIPACINETIEFPLRGSLERVSALSTGCGSCMNLEDGFHETPFTSKTTNAQQPKGGARRRSSLVSENNEIDVSWFASQGLMSKGSYKRYIKESTNQRSSSASTIETSASMRYNENCIAIVSNTVDAEPMNVDAKYTTRISKEVETLRELEMNPPEILPGPFQFVSVDDGLERITNLLITSLAKSTQTEKQSVFVNLSLTSNEARELSDFVQELTQTHKIKDTPAEIESDKEDAESLCSSELYVPVKNIDKGFQGHVSDLSCLNESSIDHNDDTNLPLSLSAVYEQHESSDGDETNSSKASVVRKDCIFSIQANSMTSSSNEREKPIPIKAPEQMQCDKPQKVDCSKIMIQSLQAEGDISTEAHFLEEESYAEKYRRLESIPSGDESGEDQKEDTYKKEACKDEHTQIYSNERQQGNAHNDDRKKTAIYENILEEGIGHLSSAMLVLLYRKLREMSMLGHVSVKLRDIDVNSYQAISRQKELKRCGLVTAEEESKGYLDRTQTAGFIVRTVLDEHQMFHESHDIFSLNPTNQISAEYDASILAEINTWVNESKKGARLGKCSLMRSLLDSKVEVVWFADRHPNDLIYGICVNRQTTTVTVVFRGQESAFARVKDSGMSVHLNPIADEDYDGSTDTIRLRSAISEEMLRVRRDTSQTVIEFIRDKIDVIGKELTNGEAYNLSVTGHGLAGGYATVLGFYLASDPTLKLASAVRLFTFASSRVGCSDFQRAFQHLENFGLIVHARFTNMDDIMSLRPFFDVKGSWLFEDWYKHVGMHISLQGRVNTANKPFGIEYKEESTLSKELVQMLRSYICGRVRHSQISEYHRRLIMARERFNLYGHGGGVDEEPNTFTLDEMYMMRDGFIDECNTHEGFFVLSIFFSATVALAALIIRIMFIS